MSEPAKPDDLGKCVVCGDPIITRDTEGGNDHCRQGHIVAIDHAEFGYGPMPIEYIRAREAEKQAAEDTVTE